MIGAICSAVVMKDNKYYFFDSHSHGPDGLSSPEGKAILKIFEALDELVLFLYSFYISCNIDLESQFEILPLSIERFVHDFLNFEPTNSTKHADRQSYMKQYMQKRRQDAKFRQKERRIDFLKRRIARGNPEYRDKERKTELLGKRTARENPDYRNKELLGKRTTREDPVYRDKERKTELLGKRSTRKDPVHRDKELLGKRSARKDPVYRDKERKTELLRKRSARKDPVYRDKERKTELLGKRSARKDPVHREKERKTELLGKRSARKDHVYRNKELLGKRSARKDPVYRDKERKTNYLENVVLGKTLCIVTENESKDLCQEEKGENAQSTVKKKDTLNFV